MARVKPISERITGTLGPNRSSAGILRTDRDRTGTNSRNNWSGNRPEEGFDPIIDRLLKEDGKRREKQLSESYTFSWDKPRFDSPLDRRRLRILNSLFFAVAKMNGKASVLGRETLDIGISFFQQHLPLSLEIPKKPTYRAQIADKAEESSDMRLCLSLLTGLGSEEALPTWQNDDARKLETQITAIAIQVVLTAETKHRENALHQHKWLIKRRAQIEEERLKRKLEAERAEKERQKRIEQGRISRLSSDAPAFH